MLRTPDSGSCKRLVQHRADQEGHVAGTTEAGTAGARSVEQLLEAQLVAELVDLLHRDLDDVGAGLGLEAVDIVGVAVEHGPLAGLPHPRGLVEDQDRVVGEAVLLAVPGAEPAERAGQIVDQAWQIGERLQRLAGRGQRHDHAVERPELGRGIGVALRPQLGCHLEERLAGPAQADIRVVVRC